MGTSSRKQIIESLGSLTAEDRARVVLWCDALGIQNLSRQDNQHAEHVFAEFSSLLSAHYRTPPQSLTTFARFRTAEYRRLLRAVERAMIAVNAWWPKTRRNVRIALLRYLCRIVFDVCTERGRRVSWAQLIPALQEIEATVNAAFPGWLRGGLFQERALARVTGGLHHVGDEPDTETKSPPLRAFGDRRSLLHDPR